MGFFEQGEPKRERDDQDADGAPPDLRACRLDYIAALTGELQQIAAQQGFGRLATILALAVAEADQLRD